MFEINKEELNRLENIVKNSSLAASQALSKLIGNPVNVRVVHVRVVPLERLAGAIADPSTPVSAVVLPVVGEGFGTSALITSHKDTPSLAELIVVNHKKAGSHSDDLIISAYKEVANIIGGAFLAGITKETGILLIQSVPEYHKDIVKNVVDTLILKIPGPNGKPLVVLEIDLEFVTLDEKLSTHYVFLLGSDFAEQIFKSMQKSTKEVPGK